MKRKFLIILLALVATLCLAFALAGCSPDPNENTGNTTEQSGNSGNNSGNSGNTGSTNTPEGGSSGSSGGGNSGNTGSTTEPEPPYKGDEGGTGSTNTPEGGSSGGDTGEIDNDGHKWSEWIVISPATCSVQGLESRKCTSEKHSEHYETRETAIDPTAHDFGELITTPATCTSTGVEAHYHCACGKLFNKDKIEVSEQQLATLSVDRNGHVLNKGESTCANCGTALTVNLKYSLLDDNTYAVGSDTATDNNIIIPAIYDGNPVTSIGAWAFNNCTSLVSITIPDSVTSIGSSAFYGCTNLESINVGENNTAYSSKSGILYNKEKTEFIHIPQAIKGTVTIPDGVTTIGVDKFSNRKSLESITIADSVTSIGKYAFGDCASLKSVNFGNESKLETIGEYAFNNCRSLTGVYIKNIAAWCNIEFGTANANPLCYASKLYLNYKPVTEITADMLQGFTEIKNYTFAGLEITHIAIPDGVTSIGAGAFIACVKLMQLTIPKSVNSIGDGAFRNCYELKSVSFDNNSELETIGDEAFYHSVIININIPDSVTSIGNSAFAYCYYLANMRFGDKSKLETIGDEAFYMCYRLKSITIPVSVTSIGGRALARCSLLTSITIPKNVTFIGREAFYGCTALSSVIFTNKNGWKVDNSIDVNVSNSSENAKMLKETYLSRQWKREG